MDMELLLLSQTVAVAMDDKKNPLLWKRVKTRGEHISKEENIC